jgi:hypothetical protein
VSVLLVCSITWRDRCGHELQSGRDLLLNQLQRDIQDAVAEPSLVPNPHLACLKGRAIPRCQGMEVDGACFAQRLMPNAGRPLKFAPSTSPISVPTVHTKRPNSRRRFALRAVRDHCRTLRTLVGASLASIDCRRRVSHWRGLIHVDPVGDSYR